MTEFGDAYKQDLYVGYKQSDPRLLLIRVLYPGSCFIQPKEIQNVSNDVIIRERFDSMRKEFSRSFYHYHSRYGSGTKQNMSDFYSSSRFELGLNGNVRSVSKKSRIGYYEYQFLNLDYYIDLLKDACKQKPDFDINNLVTAVIRAFPDKMKNQEIVACHVVHVSMFIWAAIYVAWRKAGFGGRASKKEMRERKIRERDWFLRLLKRSFYFGKNLKDVELYECFRGNQSAVTNDNGIVKEILKAMDEDLEEDEGDYEVVRKETEHVCDRKVCSHALPTYTCDEVAHLCKRFFDCVFY